MTALPFEALVFDLGGVIIPHDNAVMYRRLASRCSRPEALELIEAAAHDPRYGIGVLPIAALHQRLCREAGYDAGWDQFRDDWCCHLSVDPAMLALVQRLAEANRILLFSNTNREHWEHIRLMTGGAVDRFEPYLSHEIGQAKPEVAAFQRVAQRAGFEPRRALFIDDLTRHVAGARAAGFTAHHFTGQAGLETYLDALRRQESEAT